MPDGIQSADAKVAAPYAAFQSIKTLVKGFKENGIPGRIDRSVMNNFSGAVGGQVLTALKFLRLINADNHPQETLYDLVEAYDTPGWPQQLAIVVRGAYEPLFSLNLETASPSQFNDKFRATYAGTDEVLRKSITFFLNAAREADFKVSSYIMKNKKPRSGPTKRRMAAPNASAQGEPTTGQKTRERAHHGAVDLASAKPSEALLAMLNLDEMEEAELQAIWTLMKFFKARGQ